MLDLVDYSKLSKELYPDLNEFRSKDKWQEEEKRINKLHDFTSNLNKIKERFEKLTPKKQERITTEVGKKRELLREFLLSDADVESKLSKSLFGFYSDVKEVLVPLKSWNGEEYEKFVENLIEKL